MSGASFAIIAAILFGASTPFAKLLVGDTDPWILAGTLYFGSGIGLLFLLVFNFIKTKKLPILPSKKDFLWLFGATVFGGILGPLFLMSGLLHSQAATTSLLLNLEGVFTSVIAWLIFREHYDKRIIWGMVAIVIGGIILSWSNQGNFQFTLGSILVIGACLCWAVDNNFTRNVAANDAVLITALKSLVAGSTNLILATTLHKTFPDFTHAGYAAALGFLGYGLSIVCFVVSLRTIGTSRTGAYFSAAPFAGALLSILFFRDEFSLQLGIASLFMGLGVWLHLTETHDHLHEHDPLAHSHEHIHDEHHQHSHSPNDPSGDKHTHFHHHDQLIHKHPHYPDIHHRHDH